MRIPKDIVEEVITLNKIRKLYYALGKDIDKLSDDLRQYVARKGKKDKKGHLAVWNDAIKISLEPNIEYRINPKTFISGLPYKVDSYKFLKVLRQKVLEAIASGELQKMRPQTYPSSWFSSNIKWCTKKEVLNWFNKITHAVTGTPKVIVEITTKKKR